MNHMMKVFGLVVLGCVLLGSGPLAAQGVMPEADFFKVCKWGTVKQMNKALASGVNVNAKTSENMTALMLAAARRIRQRWCRYCWMLALMPRLKTNKA